MATAQDFNQNSHGQVFSSWFYILICARTIFFTGTEFLTGLRDYTAYLSLHAVLNFWEAVGPKTIRNHNNSLLKEAAKLLMKDWDGDLLAPENMHGGLNI